MRRAFCINPIKSISFTLPYYTDILFHATLMLSLPCFCVRKMKYIKKRELNKNKFSSSLEKTCEPSLQLKSLFQWCHYFIDSSFQYTVSPREERSNWNYYQHREMYNKLCLSGVTPVMTPTDVRAVKSQILHANKISFFSTCCQPNPALLQTSPSLLMASLIFSHRLKKGNRKVQISPGCSDIIIWLPFRMMFWQVFWQIIFAMFGLRLSFPGISSYFIF